jgi:hypothetical protein
MQIKLPSTTGVDLEELPQPIITYSAFTIMEKKWVYNKTVHQLFTDVNKAYISVWSEGLYNILNE